MTLAEWLTKRFPNAKRTTLRRMVEDRRVMVGGVPATRFNQTLTGDQQIEVRDKAADTRDHANTPGPAAPGRARTPAASPRKDRGPSADGRSKARVDDRAVPPPTTTRGQSPRREVAPIAILHEDDDVIVVIKPAGLLTSTVPREPRPTLFAILRDEVARRQPRAKVGLVHRLDRDASGLLVFSKNDVAYDSLKSQFFHHDVERVYHAVVRGQPRPPAGRIESRLVERADGVVYSTKQAGRGDRAVTDYQTVRAAKRLSLVRVTLQTGRKHQIRVHLSQRNWSILGDPVYGHGEKSPPETGLMLTATRLAFTHPRTGERAVFEIPVPDEMDALVPETSEPNV